MELTANAMEVAKMRRFRFWIPASAALAVGMLVSVAALAAQERRDHPLARIAEIEIDPQQVEPYRAALREGIEAAIRSEPGVLALYAVAVKDHPEQIRVFEVYASQAAYASHLQTAHFKKYKATTQHMVRSLKLIETDPVLLASKAVSTR